MPDPTPGVDPPDARCRPLAADPRFHFALRLPAGPPGGLLVAVHDSTRDIDVLLRGFAPLADRHGLVLLLPVFPKGPLGDGHEDGYKFLDEGPLRYDRLLHAMIDQAAGELSVPPRHFERFLLHGYSGGAQFAHRYLWLWPERLRAVCVGAPGEVTLPDRHEPWWGGIADTVERFGRTVDTDAVARVPLKLMVGDGDTGTEEMQAQPPSRCWPSDDARRGSNRQTRLQLLHDTLRALGSRAELECMQGVRHGSGNDAALARAVAFFAGQLAQDSSAVANPK